MRNSIRAAAGNNELLATIQDQYQDVVHADEPPILPPYDGVATCTSAKADTQNCDKVPQTDRRNNTEQADLYRDRDIDDEDGFGGIELLVPMSQRLTQLAAAINEHHSHATGFTRKALEHARITGEILLQAKALVGHGGLEEWVAANCECSRRTSQRYMRIARNWDRLAPKATAMTLFTITDALNELSDTDGDEDDEDPGDEDAGEEADEVGDQEHEKDAKDAPDKKDDANDTEDPDSGTVPEDAKVANPPGSNAAQKAELLARITVNSTAARTCNPIAYVLSIMRDGNVYLSPEKWEIPLNAALNAFVFACNEVIEQEKRLAFLSKRIESPACYSEAGGYMIQVAVWNLCWLGFVEQVGDNDTPMYRLTELRNERSKGSSRCG